MQQSVSANNAENRFGIEAIRGFWPESTSKKLPAGKKRLTITDVWLRINKWNKNFDPVPSVLKDRFGSEEQWRDSYYVARRFWELGKLPPDITPPRWGHTNRRTKKQRQQEEVAIATAGTIAGLERGEPIRTSVSIDELNHADAAAKFIAACCPPEMVVPLVTAPRVSLPHIEKIEPPEGALDQLEELPEGKPVPVAAASNVWPDDSLIGEPRWKQELRKLTDPLDPSDQITLDFQDLDKRLETIEDWIESIENMAKLMKFTQIEDRVRDLELAGARQGFFLAIWNFFTAPVRFVVNRFKAVGRAIWKGE